MKNFIRCLFVAAPLLAQQPISPTINDFPSREFGQPSLLLQPSSYAPNLVEGREFNSPGSIAFDNSVSPPILYVADTFNNRILAWRTPTNLNVCGTATNTVRTGSSGGCGYADLPIGQRDLLSTFAQGPGTTLSTGLFLPSAIAVDSAGNLYVADSQNNRIVRFPKPFSQTGSLQTVDLVIGQASVNSGTAPNQGLQIPNATTLALAVNHNGRQGPVNLAFDVAGNLWVPDMGNNRVLRFPVAKLAPNTSLPAADLVLGQFDFNTNSVLQQPGGGNPQTYAQSLVGPTAVVFDAAGRLYVSDTFARVMFYSAALQSGLPAQRILGINTQQTQAGQVVPLYPNQYTLGLISSGGQLVSAQQGIWVIGNNLFVADTPSNRVVRYGDPETWPQATVSNPSPPNIQVVGQNDETSGKVNKDQARPDATTLSGPAAGGAIGNELWVVDSSNHRVLAYPPQGGGNYTFATRVVGQLDYIYNAPNLIEGREAFFSFTFGQVTGSSSMAIDNSSNPPHLYVSDPFNNRVLGFLDARKVQQNTVADLVIGQTDVYSSVVNYPSGKAEQPNNTGLLGPVGLAIDAAGNLFVSDSGNGRVLRFPKPFAQPSKTLEAADLVLGQTSFNLKIQNPSQQNMGTPYGLALYADSAGTALYVSDNSFNRVLVFKHLANADFNNGQLASSVLGQANFTTTNIGTVLNLGGMNRPANLATDSSDRLYVADSQNNRLLVFSDARSQGNGASSVLQINNLSTPLGVAVSQITGEIWVANTNSSQIYRFPEFQTLQGSANIPVTAQIGNPAPVPVSPLALLLDSADNLIVADGTNRVTFYFAKLTYQNAANFSERPVAPGMLMALYRVGKDFNLTSTVGTLPLQPTLGDLQVLVNGIPAPIYFAGGISIDLMVPTGIPTSGTADFLILRPSTGEVLGAATFPLAPSNPGIFTFGLRTGTVAPVYARNSDQTVNAPSNPAKAGDFISMCLTGQGVVPNRPPDGEAPAVATPLAVPTVVIINGVALTPAQVLYSGLGCGFPGVWQINAIIPPSVPPSQAISVVVTLYDIQSNVGDVVQGGQVFINSRIANTIAVK